MKITKQEVEKAEQLIKDYKNQINTKVFKQKKCICCKKEINLISISIPDWDKQDNDWYDSANVIQLHCGYGSKHDTATVYFGLCDDCLDNAIKEGLVESLEDIKKEVRNNE